MTSIRVALADDHPIVLAGIAALIEAAPDIELVGTASNGRDALAAISHQRPDIAVIDISMPEMGGLELARRVAEDWPQVRLIALTVHEDKAYVQPLLQAGARGYLLKRSAAEELLRAIRAVAAGGLYLDPAVAGTVLPAANSDPAARPGAADELSPRERDVLRLTALGFSNKETASQLNVSVKSVETYKTRAAQKAGLRTRAEIVRFALGNGWMEGN